jgi:hypothetical protein
VGHSASRSLAFSAGVNAACVVPPRFSRAACAHSAATLLASWFQVAPNARFPPSSVPKAAVMAATILSRAMGLAPAQIDS